MRLLSYYDMALRPSIAVQSKSEEALSEQRPCAKWLRMSRGTQQHLLSPSRDGHGRPASHLDLAAL